ncbi:NADH-quinone oxidoreductase subunit M, partial [Streptomyces anulatus]
LKQGNEHLRDLVPRELAVVVPLLVALLVLGFYPKPVLDLVDPAVGHTLSTIGKHDPAPTVPAPEAGAATPPAGGHK